VERISSIPIYFWLIISEAFILTTTNKSHYVLGVDAAWTETNPSGVALLKCYKEHKKPELIKAARSYKEFCSGEEIDWNRSASGSAPDFGTLIKYCKVQGYSVDVVALDIPLSPKPIKRYRAADLEISRLYGARGAAVHAPNENRPGKISKVIYDQLVKCSFKWESKMVRSHPSFIEVYPHVAILKLWKYNYRMPYKVDKRHAYWPNAAPEVRKQNVVNNLLELCGQLMIDVDNVDKYFIGLIDESKPVLLKGYEDTLDAVICALVGWRFLQGRAKPSGDNCSAIWVPE
jgi:predicted RNase H-like nuclease